MILRKQHYFPVPIVHVYSQTHRDGGNLSETHISSNQTKSQNGEREMISGSYPSQADRQE